MGGISIRTHKLVYFTLLPVVTTSTHCVALCDRCVLIPALSTNVFKQYNIQCPRDPAINDKTSSAVNHLSHFP